MNMTWLNNLCVTKTEWATSAQEHMSMPTVDSNDKTLRFHRNVSCDWLSTQLRAFSLSLSLSCQVKMEHMLGRCAILTCIIRRVLSLPFKNLLAVVQIAFSTDEKGRNRVTTNGRNTKSTNATQSINEESECTKLIIWHLCWFVVKVPQKKSFNLNKPNQRH